MNTESELVMSPDQEAARDAIVEFVRGDRLYFGLAGAAGTGKTTVLKDSLAAAGLRPAKMGEIYKSLKSFQTPEFQHGHYLAAAYTRRAAANMIKRGVPGARTLHSICCNPFLNRTPAEVERVTKLEEERDLLDVEFEKVPKGSEPSKEIIRKLHEIEEQLEKLQSPSFEFSPKILEAVEYLVIDEASMVPFSMVKYLTSTNIRIIRVGDPYQLPPIDEERDVPRETFTLKHIHATLTQVHRQKEDASVLKLATAIRNGAPLRHGDYGNVKVRPLEQFPSDMYADGGSLILNTEFFITDKNRIRRDLNRAVRKHIYNLADEPEDWHLNDGEKITIRKNSAANDLSNGDVIRINKFEFDPEFNCYRIDSYTVLETNEFREQPIWVASRTFNLVYGARPLQAYGGYAKSKGIDILPADYGYAITCHSAQGSERKVVTVYADLTMFKDIKTKMRWAYTALTRAKEFAYIYTPELPGVEEWRSC